MKLDAKSSGNFQEWADSFSQKASCPLNQPEEAPERRDNLNFPCDLWAIKSLHQTSPADTSSTTPKGRGRALAHTHKAWREAPALLSSRDRKQSGAQKGCYMKRQRTWYLLSLWTYLKRLDSPVQYFLGVTTPPQWPQPRLWQGTLT